MITLHAYNTEGPAPLTASMIEYPKGTSIYVEGDRAAHWYEVLSGTVRTCRFLARGNRQLTGFFYSGDVFGLDDQIRCENAEAVVESIVIRHRRPVCLANLSENQSDADVALRQAFEKARDRIFLLGHRTANERIGAFLISLAVEAESDTITLPMSRTDIADHLALTMHTVSRTINELVRNNIIALEGPHRIKIINWERLHQIAGEDIKLDAINHGGL